MNGPECYEAAEAALSRLRDNALDLEEITAEMSIAQVHALLALTSALVEIGMSRGHARDSGWAKIITPRIADDEPIEELDLTIRAYNVLKREGVHTIEDLTKRTVGDLMDMRSLGAGSVEHIIGRLQEHGRNLATEPERYF